MNISIGGKSVCDIKWHNTDCLADIDLHESIASLIQNKLESIPTKSNSGVDKRYEKFGLRNNPFKKAD